MKFKVLKAHSLAELEDVLNSVDDDEYEVMQVVNDTTQNGIAFGVVIRERD